jgi:hypothetical protein
VVGTINFNLFRKTPLNINSSEIGETSIVANRPVVRNELNKFPFDTIFKTNSEKYSIPYEKNMFNITTIRIALMTFGENNSFTSPFRVGISYFNLKTKKKMTNT